MDTAVTLDNGQFLRSLYLGLLNREPDRHGFENYLKRLDAGEVTKHALAMQFLKSQEFRGSRGARSNENHAFSGYSDEDLDVFSAFDTRHVQPKPGFLTEWIGSRVRLSSLWSTLNGADFDGRVESIPVPNNYHANAVEWIGTLKAVLAAKDSFSVMELGAGQGPWLAASAAAARARGIEDLHLCGIEADPGRFALMQQNMEDNDLVGQDLVLRCAAVGVEAGKARWPRLDSPKDVAGARPIRSDDPGDADYMSGFSFYNVDEFIDVEIVALPSLLDLRPLWDLLHIDVQGTELELCQGCIEPLSTKVRSMVIGTHTRYVEGGLMDVLFKAGWILEHDQPLQVAPAPRRNLNEGILADGTQVWRNPRL